MHAARHVWRRSAGRALLARNPAVVVCRLLPLSDDASSRETLQQLYDDLNRRIRSCRKDIFSHPRTSLVARSASAAIGNLHKAMSALADNEKGTVDCASNTLTTQHSPVYLEVLSNGTTHLPPSAVIRTPLVAYLFNCPEGTSRFLHSVRVRTTAVTDVFVTRATWDNIGGINGLLLSKESCLEPTHLHGSQNLFRALQCLRPFPDYECPGLKSSRAPLEAHSWEAGSYADSLLTVHYVPVVSRAVGTHRRVPSHERTHQSDDVAYLVELNKPPRSIDKYRLFALGIRDGPLIDRLKNGEEVVLSDGRIIKPDNVFRDVAMRDCSVLFVECSRVESLRSLHDSTLIQKFVRGRSGPVYCVHFTRPDVMASAAYAEWMSSLGDGCLHVALNGTGPALPHTEGVYRSQVILNDLCPQLFPSLPSNFDGTISQSDACTWEGRMTVGRPLQRFELRGPSTCDDSTAIGLNVASILSSVREMPDFDTAVLHYKEAMSNVECTEEFPRLTFLGTSSAVPSKYRNVSGYLLELNSKSCIMVDCGEGSYGQLRVLFGDKRCDDTLLRLRAIFITHAHQDHIGGIFAVVKRRFEAFKRKNVKYQPLVLVCPTHLVSPLHLYSLYVEDLERLVRVVNITQKSGAFSSNRKDGRVGSAVERRSFANPVVEVLNLLPKELFSVRQWGLHSALAVQVHHARMSNGFVFKVDNNRKVVFSGDTKPCELLVEQGKGADILVHEATFADCFEKDASLKRHSTMRQAIDVGARMDAKHIILTHFSARYPKVPMLPEYVDRAGNVSIAMDNLSVRFGDLPLLPKLIPVLRVIFREDLLDVQLRAEQRVVRDREAEGPQNAPSGGDDKVDDLKALGKRNRAGGDQ